MSRTKAIANVVNNLVSEKTEAIEVTVNGETYMKMAGLWYSSKGMTVPTGRIDELEKALKAVDGAQPAQSAPAQQPAKASSTGQQKITWVKEIAGQPIIGSAFIHPTSADKKAFLEAKFPGMRLPDYEGQLVLGGHACQLSGWKGGTSINISVRGGDRKTVAVGSVYMRSIILNKMRPESKMAFFGRLEAFDESKHDFVTWVVSARQNQGMLELQFGVRE